mmetsp:Transcript_31118/g.50212  ORF Transcript_31118/g.50212 Transcript_31118/m.50212 type:complete len:281 (-) Transcript_31118:467-1309(-)
MYEFALGVIASCAKGSPSFPADSSRAAVALTLRRAFACACAAVRVVKSGFGGGAHVRASVSLFASVAWYAYECSVPTLSSVAFTSLARDTTAVSIVATALIGALAAFISDRTTLACAASCPNHESENFFRADALDESVSPDSAALTLTTVGLVKTAMLADCSGGGADIPKCANCMDCILLFSAPIAMRIALSLFLVEASAVIVELRIEASIPQVERHAMATASSSAGERMPPDTFLCESSNVTSSVIESKFNPVELTEELEHDAAHSICVCRSVICWIMS